MNAKIYLTVVTLLLPAVLFAQAPGGIGDLSGTSILRLWLKSDTAVSTATDGSPIDTWDDLSGAGNNLTASGGSRPYFRSQALNGHPGITFSGSHWMSVSAPNSTFNATEATLFILAYDSMPGTSPLISLSSSGYNQEFLIYGREPYHHTSIGSFVRRPHQCIPNYTGTFGLYCGVFGTEDSLTDSYFNGLKSDSARISSGAPVPYVSINRQLFLGQRLAMNSAEYLKGTIVEVIGYNTMLSNSQRMAVENYLLNKYGLLNANCGVLSTPMNTLESKEIKWYPNPASGKETIIRANIDFSSAKNLEITLWNILGQEVKVHAFSSDNTLSLKVNNLKPGIYFARVNSANEVLSIKKIMIE